MVIDVLCAMHGDLIIGMLWPVGRDLMNGAGFDN